MTQSSHDSLTVVQGTSRAFSPSDGDKFETVTMETKKISSYPGGLTKVSTFSAWLLPVFDTILSNRLGSQARSGFITIKKGADN